MHPAEAPPIDWSYYMKNVRPESVSIVEHFKGAYEQFKIPFPIDTATEQIEQQHQLVAQEIAQFIEASKLRISDYESQLASLQAMIPFDQMTMEDFIDAFPNEAPDFHNRPTFWPHDLAEQVSNSDCAQTTAAIEHVIQAVPSAVATDRTISCGEPASATHPEVMWRMG